MTTASTANLPRQSSPPPSKPNYVPAYLLVFLPSCLPGLPTCACPASRPALDFLPHIARTSVISGPNFRPTAHITVAPGLQVPKPSRTSAWPTNTRTCHYPVMSGSMQPEGCLLLLSVVPSSFFPGFHSPWLNKPRLGSLLPPSSPPPCWPPALQHIASIRERRHRPRG